MEIPNLLVLPSEVPSFAEISVQKNWWNSIWKYFLPDVKHKNLFGVTPFYGKYAVKHRDSTYSPPG